MRKRIISLITIITLFASIIPIFSLTAFAEDGDFEVVSLWFDDAVAYQPYNYRIEMVGGNEGYTFKLLSGVVPSGLNISNNNADFTQHGIITGTPRAWGSYPMIIAIYNQNGESKYYTFHIDVSPIEIKIKVTVPTENIVYDGKRHYVESVECYDYTDENWETPLDGVVPNVTYNGAAYARNVGSYYIQVTAPSGTLLREDPWYVNGEYLNIVRANVDKFRVVDVVAGYDGDTHPATVEVEPQIAYKIEYRKDGETDYTEQEPRDAGTYQVRAYTTDSNYNTATATGTVVITADAVNFHVSDNEYTYQENTSRKATVTPTREDLNWTDGEDYTVKYKNADGDEVANPTDAGEYTIEVELKNHDYRVGTIDGNLKINPRQIEFEVSNNDYTYEENKQRKATVTPSASSDYSGDFSVMYKNTKGGDEEAEPIVAGVYEIIVRIDSSNYEVIAPEETLIIRPYIYLSKGNSPKAVGVSANYYGFMADEKDLDDEESTFIAKSISDFNNAENLEMIVEDGIETRKVVFVSADQDGNDKNLYRVTYTYTDTNTNQTTTMTRYVMIVGRIGDVNGDGYVNTIDASALSQYNGDKTPKTVAQARMWDVDKDGLLNEDNSDVTAIRGRYSTPLEPYYPWIEK